MNKKKLLSEDLKQFKLMCEYNFYIPPQDELTEEDEDLEQEIDNELSGADATADDFEPEVPNMGGEEEGEEMAPEPEADAMGGQEELPEPEGEINAPGEEPAPEVEQDGGEVELDVTELVSKSEEAKMASDEANNKIDQLMSKLGELESRLPNMDGIAQKIEALQKDIEERNPTPVEKLEMRSMNSYPYNLKLTDFWDDKEIENGEGQEFEETEEEFILTQQDVEDSYSEGSVKNTFDLKDEDKF